MAKMIERGSQIWTEPSVYDWLFKNRGCSHQGLFEDPQIRFCHWHFFRALSCQANSKINNSEDRKSALWDFRTLLWTKSVVRFNEGWKKYESKYQVHKLWRSYLRSPWMNNVEKWWSGYRMVNLMQENRFKFRTNHCTRECRKCTPTIW